MVWVNGRRPRNSHALPKNNAAHTNAHAACHNGAGRIAKGSNK
ncbi:MAG: hypothetical protein BroJett015_09620 [Chloroflexota bacterium]|nr:MAG: hypothetical protein BroJett015_09620 [Chloroflexota bacterium]